LGKRNVFDTNFTVKTGTTFDWNRAFTGQVLDAETGLILYRSRYYDTKIGRFTSRDPIEYDSGDTNIYRYVKNKPINSFDLYGLACCNGTYYNPDTECCENEKIVLKESIWLCERSLNLTVTITGQVNPFTLCPSEQEVNFGTPIYYLCYLYGNRPGTCLPSRPRHSYLCCDGANKNCYGMQAYQDTAKTKPAQKGDPIPRESKLTGICEEHKVCPALKKKKCNNPTAEYDYQWYYSNCNVWAQEVCQ
jgi:RHS repeat-associated protein